MTTIDTLRKALEALEAMLTHMGMDEDDWNRPTFNQARESITALRAELERLEEPAPQLDPSKIQLCRLGVHSADAQKMGQSCNCPEKTCRLWNGGFPSPDVTAEPVASHLLDIADDIARFGSAWERDGRRIDPLSVYKDEPAQDDQAAVKAAWGRGETVQYYDCGRWLDWVGDRHLDMRRHGLWRIKPA